LLIRDVIVRLRDQFRCVALDLPGTGLSPAAARYRPSIEPAAAVFGAFILALDLRDITLVTHDVGTPVALGVA
jgi:haloalkane dehalogenase